MIIFFITSFFFFTSKETRSASIFGGRNWTWYSVQILKKWTIECNVFKLILNHYSLFKQAWRQGLLWLLFLIAILSDPLCREKIRIFLIERIMGLRFDRDAFDTRHALNTFIYFISLYNDTRARPLLFLARVRTLFD